MPSLIEAPRQISLGVAEYLLGGPFLVYPALIHVEHAAAYRPGEVHLVRHYEHPYWVYGLGGEAMTLIFEPIKERILGRQRSLPDAMLETYAIAMLAAMGMELGFGLLVNRPGGAT